MREFWEGLIAFVMLVLLALVIWTFAVVVARSHEESTHWLNKYPYSNPVTKQSCCYINHASHNLNHCREMNYTPKPVQGGFLTEGGYVYPYAQMLWSLDGKYYECRDEQGWRCMFVPKMGM